MMPWEASGKTLGWLIHQKKVWVFCVGLPCGVSHVPRPWAVARANLLSVRGSRQHKLLYTVPVGTKGGRSRRHNLPGGILLPGRMACAFHSERVYLAKNKIGFGVLVLLSVSGCSGGGHPEVEFLWRGLVSGQSPEVDRESSCGGHGEFPAGGAPGRAVDQSFNRRVTRLPPNQSPD